MGSLNRLLIILMLSGALAGCNILGNSSRDPNFGICSGFHWGDAGPVPWSFLAVCLTASANLGGATSPNFSSITFNNPSGQVWHSGVMGPNGKIYGIPGFTSGTSNLDPSLLLVIDPSNNSANLVSFPNPTKTSWYGGVLATNGDIYAVPNNTNPSGTSPQYVLKINTSNDTVTTLSFPDSPFFQWTGAVRGPNQKIYAVPDDGSNPTAVLVIDPSNDSISTISVPNPNNIKWSSAILGSNGVMYGLPENGPNPDFLMAIDLNQGTVTLQSFPNPGGPAWQGAVVANTGKIYGIPSNGGNPARVLVFNPALVSPTTFTVTNGGAIQYQGGVLAPNGKIYGIPNTQVNPVPIIIIDPSNDSGSTSLTVPNPNNEAWSGGIVSFNGSIYGMPTSGNSTATVLIINTLAARNFSKDALLSTYLNKY